MAPASRRRRRGRPRDPLLPARRRTEILAVASRIFARRGYARADVQMVADALDVGKGTVYRYFPTKRTLFLGCVDRHMQRLLGELGDVVGGVREPLDRNRPTYRRYLETGIAPWKRFYRGLMAKGRLRRMPVGRITDMTSNLLYGTVLTNLYTGRAKHCAALTPDLVDVVFHGILSDPERRRRKRDRSGRRGGRR